MVSHPANLFLSEHYGEKIIELLNEPDTKLYATLEIDTTHLRQHKPTWFEAVTKNVHKRLRYWNKVLLKLQELVKLTNDARLKSDCQVKKIVLCTSLTFHQYLARVRAAWSNDVKQHGELYMRDIILKSICPDVHGLYPVKLAIALAICSGGQISDITSNDNNKLHHRDQSHILLTGDPGMGKSTLLLTAAKIAPRAIHVMGAGCSAACLTAAAIKNDDGEWALEAGALVLADGGICCIDGFDLMRPAERASIHEAMEQQSVSLAKAGIITKLKSRCAIIAAATPIKITPSMLNIGIASPLLSRFDLVFVMRDEHSPEWDNRIADYLLGPATPTLIRLQWFEHLKRYKNTYNKEILKRNDQDMLTTE